jgi:hypothetical protein
MSDNEQWKIVDDYMSEKGFFDKESIIRIQQEFDDRTNMKHVIVANACKWVIDSKQNKTYDAQQKWIRENKYTMQKSIDEKAIQKIITFMTTPPYKWSLVAYVACASYIAQIARKTTYKKDTRLEKLPTIIEETHFVLMRACLQRMIQIRNEISEV